MKRKNEVLRTRFGPPVAFEVNPVPLRATETNELEELKKRLLRQLLAKAVEPEENTALRRAANDAAALAWLTRYPLLVFPELLREKAETALFQNRKQVEIRERSLNLLPQAA
jgi:hypothetical protein